MFAIRGLAYRCTVFSCCVLLTALLLTIPALSQQEEPALVLDPTSAAGLALRNSTQLKIDACSVDEAEAQLRQALAVDNWTVDLSANLLRRGPAPELPPEFRSFFVKTIHAEALSASKVLWTWGKLEAQRELAKLGLEAAQTQRAVTELALAKLAREAVLKLAYDEQLLDIEYETLASMMEHERVTRKRHAEGLIAFFEVAQAEAQVASVEGRIAQRKANVARSQVALRQVVNVDQTTPVVVSVNNLPEQPELDLRGCIEYALDHRPEMRQMQAAVRLQEAGIRVAQSSLRPTVAVSAQVQDQTASFTSTPLSYQIVLAFEKPIFDGGQQKAEVRAARARAEATRLQLQAVAEKIATEVADQYVQIEQFREQIAKADMQSRAAREQLRIARLRFEENLGLGYEVIDAQTALSTAMANRALAELNLHLALVRLRAAMGITDLQEAPEE